MLARFVAVITASAKGTAADNLISTVDAWEGEQPLAKFAPARRN